MNSDQIRSVVVVSDQFESIDLWLREIALQLALMNERADRRSQEEQETEAKPVKSWDDGKPHYMRGGEEITAEEWNRHWADYPSMQVPL